jgi:hypothetical protein
MNATEGVTIETNTSSLMLEMARRGKSVEDIFPAAWLI